MYSRIESGGHTPIHGSYSPFENLAGQIIPEQYASGETLVLEGLGIARFELWKPEPDVQVVYHPKFVVDPRLIIVRVYPTTPKESVEAIQKRLRVEALLPRLSMTLRIMAVPATMTDEPHVQYWYANAQGMQSHVNRRGLTLNPLLEDAQYVPQVTFKFTEGTA